MIEELSYPDYTTDIIQSANILLDQYLEMVVHEGFDHPNVVAFFKNNAINPKFRKLALLFCSIEETRQLTGYYNQEILAVASEHDDTHTEELISL